MNRLKIAIQKSGRLSEKSLELLRECGNNFPDFKYKLKNSATNIPLEILFLRDDDIPKYVEQNIVHIGILGENEVLEQDKDIKVIKKLGFARCRLSLAVTNDSDCNDISYFKGKKIATSYPNILTKFFQEQDSRQKLRRSREV